MAHMGQHFEKAYSILTLAHKSHALVCCDISRTLYPTLGGKRQMFAAMASDRGNLGAPAFDSSNGALFEYFF
jgi:hypothetical protein